MDWIAQLDLPSAHAVEVMDADLSTVTTLADRVFRVHSPEPWVLHLELQASRDRSMARRLLQYNVLLHVRHELSVRSVLVLLRPEADDRELTGRYHTSLPRSRRDLEFRYSVVRVWREPPERFLEGGVGTVPLAPLSDVPPSEIESVVKRMEDRLNHLPHTEAATLWTCAYILMGLRYSPELTERLMKGLVTMEESTTYQAILAKGRAEGRTEGQAAGEKHILLRLGSKRLGAPNAHVRQRIESITSMEELERLTDRLLEVGSWDELLASSRSEPDKG